MQKGGGATMTVASITGTDTLYLTNVQGQSLSSGDLVLYNDSGNAVSYANTDITASTVTNPLFEGDVIEISHYNHGMTAGNNTDQIRDIQQLTSNSLFTYPGLDLTNDFNRLSNLILEYTKGCFQDQHHHQVLLELHGQL